MWYCIKNLREYPPDPFAERIADMLRRTVEDEEDIPYVECQDLLDEIEEEPLPDVEELLEEHHLTLSEAVEQAEADRSAFLDTLQQLGLPLDNRFELCRKLCELAQTAPSDELLRLYCDILSDGGFLNREDYEEDEDCGIVRWLHMKDDSESLYQHLSEQKQLASRWKRTLEQAKKIRPLKADRAPGESPHLDEVFQLYCSLIKVPKNEARFLDNLAWVLRIADREEALAAIKPLFLYQMLVRRGKHLHTGEGSQFDFCTLWNYYSYMVEKDNDKNFKDYGEKVVFFDELCRIFSSDKGVDIPLCLHGFDHVSNLGEFTRAPDILEFPFPPLLEDILAESMFTCFENENGANSNVMLSDSGFSSSKLDRFRRTDNRRLIRGGNRISKYINDHYDELVLQFVPASPDEVRRLCGSVLESSGLRASEQPKNAEETALFLAAINDCLMEMVEDAAEAYLEMAGDALIGADQL